MPTAVQTSFGLSRSEELRSPVAVGVPGLLLLSSPASTTVPVTGPVTSAASLAPLMVMVTSCWVPSTVKAANVSVSVCPTLRACTAGLSLSSV